MASSWRPTFTARPDFMGFEQTGNYMPPRRRPSNDARFPEWFQAVPRKYKYPWNELKLPAVSSEREALKLVLTIKGFGNECFRRGENYDALWKYEHALLLCYTYPHQLSSEKAALHSNIAAVCLKMGDSRDESLLDPQQFPPSHVLWYAFTQQHSSEAIALAPEAKILHKAFYRRAESLKKLVLIPEMKSTIKAMAHVMPSLFLPQSDPYYQLVWDFVQCFQLQDNPEPKIICDALMVAVDNGPTELLPSLKNKDIDSGFTSRLLYEVIAHPQSTAQHINYLLLKVEVDSTRPRKSFYDASKISATQVLKKGVRELKCFELLIEYGMPMKSEDIACAVGVLPESNVDILKFLVTKCKEYGVADFDKAIAAAKKYNNQQFLNVLGGDTKVAYDQLKEEGNSLFQKGSYSEALGKYFQALNYCRQHNMKEQMALIRANCAMACLKMRLYSDAYTHCMECVKIDPENHKGYFRRAEALKGILSNPPDGQPPPGTYEDVVRDYAKCHRLHSNLEALYNAVALGYKHKLNRLIPHLSEDDVSSGLSTKLLRQVVDQSDINEAFVMFVLFKLPQPSMSRPYDASGVDILHLVTRVSEVRIIKRLFELGMKLEEKHLKDLVMLIPPGSLLAFEFILQHARMIGFQRDSMNSACSTAMKLRKLNFIALLIENGATPHPTDLIAAVGVCDNPTIEHYLATNTMPEPRRKPNNKQTNFQDCSYEREVVRELNAEAKHYYKDLHDYEGALERYFKALDICKKSNLTEEAASIHGNCAHLLLQAQSYYQAYQHANTCINLFPSYDKAYIRRAEALKKAIQSGRFDVPVNLTYENVIADYCRGHELKSNVKAFVEAILIAVDNGRSGMVIHIRRVDLDFCNKVLLEILSRPECKEAHLEFLVSKMWNEKKINVSKVTLKQLVDKGITSASLLQRFLELGLPLSKEDIMMAIKELKHSQVHLFKHIAAKCDPGDIDELCQTAVSAKRMTFVLNLVERGAKLPSHGSDMLFQALKIKDYDGALFLAKKFTKATMDKLDLSTLMETNIIYCTELIKVLVESGLSPNGRRRKTPAATVMGRTDILLKKKIELLCLLIDVGEDCNHLSNLGKSATTPLHVATDLALQTGGDLRLIGSVVCSPSFNLSKLTNDKGESPLHLAIKSHLKKDLSTTVLSALLETEILDPLKRDQSGKRPMDYLSKSDSRMAMLDEAVRKFKPEASQQKKKQKKKKTKSSSTSSVSSMADKQQESQKEAEKVSSPHSTESVDAGSSKHKEVKREPVHRLLTIQEKVELHIKRLMSKSAHYFEVEVTVEASYETPQLPDGGKLNGSKATDDEKNNKEEKEVSSDKKEEQNSVVTGNPNVQPPEDVAGILAEFVDGLDFDKLPWEVEVTAKVVKFFKDTKKTPSDIRGAAAKTIYRLAEGRRSEHLSKIVSNEKSLQLYEARMTKAARVLWEKAISYSAKLTGASAIPVYSEVIRVWEIVLDHDNLDRRIKYCIDQIEKSHIRGFEASVRWSLLPEKTGQAIRDGTKVRGQELSDIPMRFLLPSITETASEHHFIPAASTKEDEYNVTTFYSFETITFRSMLLGTNDRRDFPFKEWQKEHEIIKLTSKEAILLLGRSGTGKTTCCLYRLWNEFKNFWNPESNTFGWKIPRRCLIPPAILMPSTDVTQSAEEEESNEFEADSASDGNPQDSSEVVHVRTEPQQLERESASQDECDATSPSIDSPNSPSLLGAAMNVFQVGDSVEVVEEDLHQVFITKNYVLCDQMKKRFYNMAAAFKFLDKHMKYELTDSFSDLSKVEDCAFPLFLTARQFYILLDNSLCDGRAFFHRDEEGNLKVKITSLDYDHEDPDILLDLEQSDSENEDIDVSSVNVAQSSSKGHSERWTEVTALYFKEFIWPNISHQCGISSKDFDPLLVWIEIQSFIKGSEAALRKGHHLSIEEYKKIGNRMAPNFSSHRDTIYKLYLKYRKYKQNQRHHNFLFDECDLVLHLYNRLKDVQDVPWSVHSLYIDEVQDFTQAELAIFIHCCRDPNSMFFTGDTAQSIMRGIAFRFQDLRSLFHRIHSKIPLIKVPQKPHNLTINFRSHSGILKLAGSIIDLISEFFKDSIDHLPDDEGMFPGPTPVLLESCKIDDLALLLSTNKREASAIEFGAHQVIIVQSKEAKDSLPSILKGAIVLTIFEAKGLEFDDVLLYNFFTDSMVDEKGWRVISSYLEMSQHQSKVTNSTMLPGSSEGPRSRQFDAKLHKSLNSELKYLYTAVTRAKCNLWIYDSDRKARLPMFDYWYKRNLVKVVQAQPSAGGQGVYTLVFASNSTPEQWKAQGDNFKKKHLWEQAILCYQRAGIENEYLAKEAHAYHLIQRARHQKPQLYLEAALSFLECDELHHSRHYLNGAALCLRNSKKHHEAAKLFEKLGEFEKAAQSYLRGRDIDNFARLKESVGQQGEVVRALMGKPFMRKRDALTKASEYEGQGIKLAQDLSTSELSYSCAKFYSERRDRDTLIEVLNYMPEVSRKVKFLKEAKLYEEAFDALAENKEFKDAYRIASAQGASKQGLSDLEESWLQKGLTLAEKNRDEFMIASFVFQMAKMEYTQLQIAEDKHETVDSGVVKNLDTLIRTKNSLVKAQAYLLLGMLKRDVSFCRTAWRTYHSLSHRVGELEAFNQIQQLASESDQSLLDVCHIAKETGNTLMKASDIVKVVKEALSFYGLQKIGGYYYTPQGQDIWIGEPLMKCLCKSNRQDLDGMLKLEASDARDELAKHCMDFKTTWLKRFNLKKKLEPKLMSFPLHKQLWERRHLMRQYSTEEVTSEALREYLRTSVHLLELRSLREESTDGLIVLLVSIFTPRVYIYLPYRIKEDHIAIVRRSVNSHNIFQRFIKDTVEASDSEKFPDRVKADLWLMAWRASCISQPDLKYLIGMLQKLEKKVNEDSKAPPTQPGEKYEPPPGFIYWRNDKKYYHIFWFWLQSCIKMREEKRFLWSSKLAIYRFLGTIAEYSHQCSITVINVVDILCIHCTGLLAMITHANALQDRGTSCTVPYFYKSNVVLFSHMNSYRKEDRWLLSACADEVRSWRNLGRLFGECRTLLVRALGLLIGSYPYAQHYSVLKIGLKKIAATDATKQCLILALVLFGNLSMLRVRETREFHQKIQILLKRSLSKEESMPNYVGVAYKAISNPRFTNPVEVFNLVEWLLRDAKVDSTLARLVFRAKGQHGKVDIVPMQNRQPQKPLPNQRTVPLPVSVPPTVSGPPPVAPGPPPSHRMLSRSTGSTGGSPLNPNVPPFSSVTPAHDDVNVPFSAIPTQLPYTAVPQQSTFTQPPLGYASLPLASSSVDVPLTGLQAANSAEMPNPIGFERRQQVRAPEAQEPVKARVVASYTADELKKLYAMSTESEGGQVTGSTTPHSDNVEFTSNQPLPDHGEFIPFTFEVPEYAEQEEAKTELELDSREQDDDMSMTLAGGELGELPLNPELADPSIVSSTFCNACGVHLKSEQYNQEITESMEPGFEVEDLEPYIVHVHSELHNTNIVLCKQFMAITSNESGTEVYPEVRRLLIDLLHDCQMLRNQYDSDKLDRPIDIIQEELDKNDRIISELEETCSWRKAIDEISKMAESMDRLLKSYRSLHTQLSDELKRSKRWNFRQDGTVGDIDVIDRENKEQEEFDQLSERFDPADVPVTGAKGGSTSGSKRLRSEEEKLKSRRKKKGKRPGGGGMN